MVPLKQRAPEYQRSKAPENFAFFLEEQRSEKEKIGQNQFAFSISQLKPLLAFHLIPIKTACLAAAL